MENSDHLNKDKDKDIIQTQGEDQNGINQKKIEHSDKRDENQNLIIENNNQQIINEKNSLNTASKNNIYEEEKNNDEEEKRSEEEVKHERLLRQKKIQQINIRKAQLKEMEKKYNELFDDITKNWENNKENYEKFYDTKVYSAIVQMLYQPCINANQEIISYVFKFLCNYFYFLKDKLKEIPLKHMYIINLILDINCNIFSKNPKINNNFNYDKFEENYDLINDKLFYYLFKEILPNAEIENSEIGFNYNCMMKYFLEYLIKIGFNDNYINIFLYREDIDGNHYVQFVYYAFYLLNFCDRDFLLKHNYNINLIRNFTNRMTFWLNNSQIFIKNNKENYLKFLESIVRSYFTIIFGGLNNLVENLEKNNMEEETQNFLFSIYNFFEYLLKQQKLELRIFSITQLKTISILYKSFRKEIKIFGTKKVFEYTKKIFISFLVKINIFDLVFGENIHEALIERSYEILSLLYKNNKFSQEQISLLWKISQSKYQSISNSIITLFGKILPEFSNEDCNTILKTISKINFNEVNEVTLKLLENFFLSEHRHENLLNILFKYSNELSFYEGLSGNIIDKSRTILKKLLFNKKYINDLIRCIKNCLFCLDNNYLLNTNRNLFIEIINEFIHNEKSEQTNEIFKSINENINNFGMLLSYMDEKYSIFMILMNHLLFLKKLFIFFSEEAILLKRKNNEENIDIDSSVLNVDNYLIKYKEYMNLNINHEISDENINNGDTKNENNFNYLLPKNNKDIDNYLKIIIKDFIFFLKDNILKKDIKLTNNEIIYNIFNQFEFCFEKDTYHRILIKIIDTIFNFHEFSNNYIKRELLDLLYNLLIDNYVYEGEKEIFFDYIKNLIVYQIHNYHLNLITDENIEYICLEKISSNEINTLPYSAYEAFNSYIKYINNINGNIVYSQVEDKFIEIKKINLLIGFKTLLQFYISNNDLNITMKSLSCLTNIIEVASCDMDNRKYLLDVLFSLLENYKTKIKESSRNSNSKIAFRRLLRLISVVNKTKVTKNLYDKNDPNNLIDLNINNNFYNNNDDNHFINIKAFKGLTIKEFKKELIEKVICTNDNDILLYNNINNNPYRTFYSLEQIKNELINNDYIILCYNDLILKNDFTLIDYNIKSGDNIIILNSISSVNGGEYSMSEEQLKDAYEQIKVVFNDKFSEEIMKQALYNNKGDIQNTIIYMTDENNIMILINEIDIKKKSEPTKKEELICLEEKKFNLLLDILNEGDNDLNDCVWDLFSEIKFPDEFIINSIENDFDKINNENNLNKKILILKIVNSVIFDDNKFCKNNKLNKNIKNKWISKFMNNEKSIIENLIFLSKINIENASEINFSQIIDIIINFFKKIFTKINNLNKNKKQNIINTNEKENENNKNNNIINDNINEKGKIEEVHGEFDIEEKDVNNFIKILIKNNFINLIYNIIFVVLQLSKERTKQIKKNALQNLYSILIEYLIIVPLDVNKFLEEEKKNKTILNILTTEKQFDIRKSSLDFIKKLIENIKPNNENNFNIQSSLLNYYYSYLISNEVYNEEFYELYNYLFNIESLQSDIIPIDIIIAKFFDNLCEFYTNSEKMNDSNNHNLEEVKNKIKYNLYILCSFYPIYNELLKNEIEKKLLENKNIIILLYNCIFKIEKDNNNNLCYLFSDDHLRNNSFILLSNLISLDKKYFDMISPKLYNHHKKIIEKITDFPLDYPLRDVQSKKFLGLKNFGATCYLNSLFQQMFMIPTFKRDIFNFDISEVEDINNRDSLQESTLYNMQITFANLQKSIMAYYPPISFIKSFKKAFNGEPIHLGVQQDTDEFLAILCDKLEKEAKKFGKENFLENSFKGKITNEIVSLEKEYPYYSQTEEPFYRITLDIKGHKNLEDALDAYVKGEILDGDNKYYVEKYKKKISIKKRTSIKKIGNQIIIHLKRFEFDFVTFQNNKLNDYLKFPLIINLKKWTRASLRMNEVKDEKDNNISEEEKENLDEEKMNYELTGILVHSGSSLQSGHYYSFIKDLETGKWHQFNDSVISDYNIDRDLEKECFGNINSKTNQFGKGAYLLFYTKKECVYKNKNYNKEIKINDIILKEVENNNIGFLKIKTYASEVYHKFFIKFINLSLNYLKKENNDNDNKESKDNKDIDSNSINNEEKYSLLMTKKLERQIQIYQKLLLSLKDNKENNIIDENKLINIPNIEELYNNCKNEIINKNINNKKEEIEGINIEIIINIFFYYFFGIVIQYSDKEAKLKDCVSLLKEIIKENNKYSVNIMKLIEENISIFSELLFKYGFIDKDMTGINQYIYDMYKTLFYYNYNYEKEKYGFITPKFYTYFNRDDKGKLIIEKSSKSLFLRVFKKIFLDNLEKCRKEYSRDSLFLNLFLLITISNPESCLLSSDYLIPLISFITNNNIPEYKSKINPNYKMGNNPNPIYLSLFYEIILRCATPWMQTTKNRTPYILFNSPQNLENTDLYLYPKLPNDWEIILTKKFFIQYILSNNIINCSNILCHLSYENESISVKIMGLVNNLLKETFYQYPLIENVTFNTCKVFDLNDSFTFIRLETLFELEKVGKKDNEKQTLIDFYINVKYKLPILVLEGLFIISKVIEKHRNIYEYFKINKNTLQWVKEYYLEFFMDDDKYNLSSYLGNVLKTHQDLFEVIEKNIIVGLDV